MVVDQDARFSHLEKQIQDLSNLMLDFRKQQEQQPGSPSQAPLAALDFVLDQKISRLEGQIKQLAARKPSPVPPSPLPAVASVHVAEEGPKAADIPSVEDLIKSLEDERKKFSQKENAYLEKIRRFTIDLTNSRARLSDQEAKISDLEAEVGIIRNQCVG